MASDRQQLLAAEEDPTREAEEVRSLVPTDPVADQKKKTLSSRVFVTAVVGLAAVLLAAVVLVPLPEAARRPSRGAAVTRHGGGGTDVELAAAAPPACGAAGQECTKSKCCWSGGKSGLQCYAKDDFWATCSETCEKGLHPNEYDGKPWSCEELGDRSLPAPEFCPKPGENCLKAPCCQPGGKAGLQCFQKNDTFAGCLEACDEEAEDGSKWACKPLGGRSAPLPEFCPKSGENCIEKSCCANDGPHGLQCYKKNKYYAGCMPPGTCQKGFRKDENASWACDPLGAPSAPGEDFCPLMNHNCIDSNCCAAGGVKGLQCYQKDDTYAQCMESCDPKTMKGWSCHPRGYRSRPDPCSAPGEDCRSTKCCSSARGGQGMTCFEKDKSYATCQETCDDSGKGDDKWSCKALGNRTKYTTGCSWGGTDCSKTQCCNNEGYACAVKDEHFTGCVQTMSRTTWMKKKIPMPAGWNGKILGWGKSEFAVKPADKKAKVAGTTLFCFMAILPNSSEVTLMELARKNKASIFACEEHAVHYSWKSGSGAWDTGTSTLVNTDVFIKVWDQIRVEGKYAKYDWSVKVDADCVFVPDRLRSHLQRLRPPAYQAIYLKNNGMDPGLGNSGFLGAIEIFSKRAVQVYFDNAEGCKKYFGLGCGEDGFFKGCMDALGVGYMKDVDIFFPDHGAGACRQGQRVAFHPLKDPKDWQHCIDIISGKKQW